MIIEGCLFPGCPEPKKTRGLCSLHYTYAYRLVKRKQTTWEKLEQENKISPKRGIISKSNKWFLEGEVEGEVNIKE
jgi:hypothetical protein